jgi:hypothetical protein
MKQGSCKHCNTTYDLDDKPKGWMANHSRWCDSNPKRNAYVNNMEKARNAKTIEGRKRAAEKVSEHHKNGVYDHVDHRTFLGRKHTDESKQKTRVKALASKHRRLRKGVVEYKGVMLDSSWELALAQRLDELNIEWVRPDPIPWIDTAGVTHNYFPDFYLPKYDVYLDPKNPAAFKAQTEKVHILMNTYKNIVFIQSLSECRNYTP